MAMEQHLPHSPMATTPRLLVTVQEAAQMLGIGKTKLYELIRTEEIPVIHVGKMVRIDPRKLQEWIDSKGKEQEG